jgi:hypothetical protein
MKILNFKTKKIQFYNFEFFLKIFKFYMKFCKIFESFDLCCNLIGRLKMKSRLWLDNVETPNRQ